MRGVRGGSKRISVGGTDRGLHYRTCESCDAGAGTAADGHKLESGFPELQEGEWSLSGDFVEVKFPSASGNTCVFNLCNQDGLGATVACKTHKASELEIVIEEC